MLRVNVSKIIREMTEEQLHKGKSEATLLTGLN